MVTETEVELFVEALENTYEFLGTRNRVPVNTVHARYDYLIQKSGEMDGVGRDHFEDVARRAESEGKADVNAFGMKPA